MASPIATSAFNRLDISSPGYRAYCYAELAVSSLAVSKTIASTHCASYGGTFQPLTIVIPYTKFEHFGIIRF